MHNTLPNRERVNSRNACHSERSGVSVANETQSRNPAKQRVAWIAGFLDSATPSTLQQSAGLRSARNDTRFFQTATLFCDPQIATNHANGLNARGFEPRFRLLTSRRRSR